MSKIKHNAPFIKSATPGETGQELWETIGQGSSSKNDDKFYAGGWFRGQRILA